MTFRYTRAITEISRRRRSYDLNISQTQLLDDMIGSYYEEWVQGIPNDTEDLFFLERQPISVSLRYGQNSDLDPPGSTSALDAMARNHDMSLIRNFSFATAVHIR